MLALVLAAAALAKPLPPFEPVKRRPLAPPPTPPRVERPPSPEDLAREAWAAAPPRRAACANATRSATTREATSWRRRGQRETGARFDPLSTVQCGLERCRAAWGAAAGTRVSAKHEARSPSGLEARTSTLSVKSDASASWSEACSGTRNGCPRPHS